MIVPAAPKATANPDAGNAPEAVKELNGADDAAPSIGKTYDFDREMEGRACYSAK